MATASEDMIAKVRNASKAHTDVLRDVAFTSDASRALSTSWDGTMKIWPVSKVSDSVSPHPAATFAPQSGIYARLAVAAAAFEAVGLFGPRFAGSPGSQECHRAA
jgi:hypothetical protein